MQCFKKQEKLMQTDRYGMPLVAARKMVTLAGAVALICVLGFATADRAEAQDAEPAVSVTQNEASRADNANARPHK